MTEMINEEDMKTVIVEPKEGYSDEDIMNILWVWGAYYIEKLTDGFISAELDEYYLYCLEKIAFVHIKEKHRMHGSHGLPNLPIYKGYRKD